MANKTKAKWDGHHDITAETPDEKPLTLIRIPGYHSFFYFPDGFRRTFFFPSNEFISFRVFGGVIRSSLKRSPVIPYRRESFANSQGAHLEFLMFHLYQALQSFLQLLVLQQRLTKDGMREVPKQ